VATASPNPVLVADTLTYTYTVSNTGPSTATGVNFSNALPPSVTFLSATVSQGNWTTEGNILLANLSSLEPGASATITATVQPNTPGTITSYASVGAFENDLHSGDNRVAIPVTVNWPQVDLALGLSAAPSPVIVGSNLNYTVTVTNKGPGNALGVAVTNALPPATTFVGGTASQGDVSFNDGVVTAALGFMAPGADATVNLTLAPRASGSLTNTITATSASAETNPDDNSATAIVTVVDPGPSIVAAGSILLEEEFLPPNGTVDPGETVTVSLALANVGVVNATNVIATLLPTGGVTAPSGDQSYGTLVRGGPSVSRPFTFTASPQAIGQVVATLELRTAAKSLGYVAFTFEFPNTVSLANTGFIMIPDHGIAAPYPSPIIVSGLTGLVSKVTVSLNGLSHGFLSDVSVLLAGPANRNALLMSHAGGGFAVTNLTLTFDDTATNSLPYGAPITASGSFQPSGYGTVAFPPPAPLGPYPSALATFLGGSPNGTWAIYVFDDSAGDAGGIASGWSLDVTTTLETARPRLSADFASGSLVLTIYAQPGLNCEIQACADLASWETIGNGTAGSNGMFKYTDPNTSSFTNRFYRVLTQLP